MQRGRDRLKEYCILGKVADISYHYHLFSPLFDINNDCNKHREATQFALLLLACLPNWSTALTNWTILLVHCTSMKTIAWPPKLVCE